MSVTTPSPWAKLYRQHPTAPTLPQTDGSSKGASPYRRGKQFEDSVKGRLQRRLYFVMRAGASKGKIDLLATGPATARIQVSGLFIQCKRTGQISSAEWNEVYDIAREHGGWPVVCFRPSARTVAFMRLDAPREKGKQGRPWTAIDPEDCSVIEELPTLPLA